MSCTMLSNDLAPTIVAQAVWKEPNRPAVVIARPNNEIELIRTPIHRVSLDFDVDLYFTDNAIVDGADENLVLDHGGAHVAGPVLLLPTAAASDVDLRRALAWCQIQDVHVAGRRISYYGVSEGAGYDVVYTTRDGLRSPLRHIVRHSPMGLTWGFQGNGPLDLALSVLADYLNLEPLPDGRIPEIDPLYERFAREFINTLPADDRSWSIDAFLIGSWLRANPPVATCPSHRAQTHEGCLTCDVVRIGLQ